MIVMQEIKGEGKDASFVEGLGRSSLKS